MSTVVAARENKTAAGVLIMAAGVFFLTMIDTSAKWLAMAGLPVIQIVFMRYAVHFALSTGVMVPREGMDVFRSRAPIKQILRSIFLLASTVFLVLALGQLSITLNTTIIFAMPIVVTLLSIPILGEQVGMHRLGAVCVGFLGVLVVMQPWGASFQPAMLFSFGAVVSGGLYMIMTRMIAGVESNATSQIWSSGLATVGLLPFVLYSWVWPDTMIDWMFFALIGAFGAIAHTLVTGAHRLADASVLAPVLYIQLLFATFVGALLFNTWPTFWTLVGGVIIISSGLYIWHRERARTPI